MLDVSIESDTESCVDVEHSNQRSARRLRLVWGEGGRRGGGGAVEPEARVREVRTANGLVHDFAGGPTTTMVTSQSMSL